MTARGELFSRHTEAGGSRWRPAQRVAGVWSPYSSPATTVDRAGRLWLAAVRTDGSVPVSSMARRLGALAPRGREAQLAGHGQSVLPRGPGGVRVGTVTALGRPVWGRTAAAPPVVVPADTVAHPGGFAAVLTMILHL